MGSDPRTRLATIVVSQPFAEHVGPAALQIWAQIIAETAADSGTDDATQVTESLVTRFAAADFEMSPVEVERLAEQLADPHRSGVEVRTNDGRVLAASGARSAEVDDASGTSGQPEVGDAAGQLEPEDPDRPFYS